MRLGELTASAITSDVPAVQKGLRGRFAVQKGQGRERAKGGEDRKTVGSYDCIFGYCVVTFLHKHKIHLHHDKEASAER